MQCFQPCADSQKAIAFFEPINSNVRQQMKKGIFIKTTLSIIILLASFCFLAYGATLISAEGAPNIVIIFGVSSFIYGTLSVILLISIYLKKKFMPIKVINYFGFLFLLSFVLVSLDAGSISGFEWLGIFIVAILVFAISQLFKRSGAFNNVA